MRCIKKIHLVVLFITTLFSCQKLEEQPYSFLNRENFYTNQLQLESAVNGAYAVLPAYIMNNLYLNVFSDEGTSQIDNQLDVFSYDANNAVIESFWTNCYLGINRANEVLAHADLVVFDTEANRNKAKGEAKFLRGVLYFYLATYFGDVPKRVTPTQGVNNVPKSPATEIYQQVIDDFNDAVNLLATTAAFPAKPTKFTALAFLARTYLYTEDWNNAAATAQQVMQSNQFELLTPYDKIWLKSNENNKELIYSIQTGTALANTWVTYILPADVSDHPGGKGIHRIAMEKAYIKSFAAADTRKTSYDTTYKKTSGIIGFISQGLLEKFITKTGLTGLDKNLSGINYPLIRYADIVLIYAEAKCRLSGSPVGDPLLWLNNVRRRAYGLPLNTPSAIDVTAADQNTFLQLLMRERYWEFGGEGLRWGDLLRTKTFVSVMTAAGKTQIRDKHRYFPLPRTEVVSSGNVVTQNPAWQ